MQEGQHDGTACPGVDSTAEGQPDPTKAQDKVVYKEAIVDRLAKIGMTAFTVTMAAITAVGGWTAVLGEEKGGHGPVAAIARQWHGRTPTATADEYEKYLGTAIKKFTTIPGNRGYQMMRETVGDVTHFSVISYWDSREAIRAYAGDDISKVRDLPRDPDFLIEPERTVRNYDLVTDSRKP
jgi:heme-degrading monooxygenase HmoA